jgi:valyl-tRNA synthetase
LFMCYNELSRINECFTRWESQGFFEPNFERGGDPFVVPMPPPNVTGSLHMGHTMFVTLEVG